ncbi:MAG: tyrosine-type recombinase/integrase [Lachnospiraceae bacterium]|nr:tyrosine-type recombinase/integrase [Lachnospiraceae bacterium]
MAHTNTFRKQNDIQNIAKLRTLIKNDLPPFAADYFRGIENTTTTRTRINYAYDIRTFFRFLQQANPEFEKKTISQFTLDDLDCLEAVDIEEYLSYLKLYDYDGVTYTNDERAIHRKLSALRSFYLYYQKRNMIKNNPTTIVDMPKLHKREIIRLDADEVEELLELVENGGKDLTGMKKVYYEKNKLRNIAIFTLLLGTGLRVSECVGLDIDDIDFKEDRLRIIRKGGKEEYIYFGEEVRDALINYINNQRALITAAPGHEQALFYSIQKRRMSIQAVENLVKDYSSQITTFKHITPHKLRSTYGTNLYRSTQDIYLVAEVLGHNDVNTTRNYYAALDDDKKRSAANAVNLRKRNKDDEQ